MKKVTIQPLGENVLVQIEKPEQRTAAGIYLPETAKDDRSQFGTVVAVGGSEKMTVQPGDRVIFRLYGGEEVTLQGEKFLLTTIKDILAVVK